MSIQPNKLPQDKTAAERALRKLIVHFAFIAVFNAALAALVLYDNGHIVSWSMFWISVISQGVLALATALVKYYQASGQTSLSVMFDAIRQEAQAKAPPIQYSTNDLALQQAFNTALQPQYAYQTPAYAMPTQSATTPASLKPVQLQPMPASSMPVAPVIVPNTPPANAMLLSTVPEMPAIQAQQ